MQAPAHSIALSALQHYLYCPRQCALIHVEREWAENLATAEGNVLHKNAHSGRGESRPGVRIARGLEVRSVGAGLHGVCDVVEIHRDGRLIPIEYKRGKPKAHRGDEIQLCGQAICLEETFGLKPGGIESGCLFYGKLQRRVVVLMDETLRQLTLEIAQRVRELLEQGATPGAEYSAKLCNPCSLLPLCQPYAQRFRRGTDQWFSRSLEASLQHDENSP